MENPIKMDDLVVPPIFGNIHIQYTIRFPINLARSKQPMTMWDNDPTVRDVLNLELCLPSCVSCFWKFQNSNHLASAPIKTKLRFGGGALNCARPFPCRGDHNRPTSIWINNGQEVRPLHVARAFAISPMSLANAGAASCHRPVSWPGHQSSHLILSCILCISFRALAKRRTQGLGSHNQISWSHTPRALRAIIGAPVPLPMKLPLTGISFLVPGPNSNYQVCTSQKNRWNLLSVILYFPKKWGFPVWISFSRNLVLRYWSGFVDDFLIGSVSWWCWITGEWNRSTLRTDKCKQVGAMNKTAAPRKTKHGYPKQTYLFELKIHFKTIILC